MIFNHILEYRNEIIDEFQIIHSFVKLSAYSFEDKFSLKTK